MRTGVLAMVMSLAVTAACGTVPDRNPIPPEYGEEAEIPGIPDARFWGDERPPFFENRLALSVDEIKRQFPDAYGREQNLLAIVMTDPFEE